MLHAMAIACVACGHNLHGDFEGECYMQCYMLCAKLSHLSHEVMMVGMCEIRLTDKISEHSQS